MAFPMERLRRFNISCKLMGALSALTLLGSASSAQAKLANCITGNDVEAAFCPYIVHYNRDVRSLADPRILQVLGNADPSKVRSIALIIAITKYPVLGDDLVAADADAKNLVNFFVNDQKFDEVILLKDEEATHDRIDDFLRVYLPSRARAYKQFARLVVAYSGHGTQETTGNAGNTPAAFLLSNASGASDTKNSYVMTDFGARIRDLSKGYFQVLALVNACYGGAIYGGIAVQPGGNADDFTQAGSYALAAGSPFKEVVSLDPKRGSLFFDAIISGIKSGKADIGFDAYVAADGTFLQYGGLTRLGALNSYLSSQFYAVNRKQIPTDHGPLKIDPPWLGPIVPLGVVARGGPFFLSPKVGEAKDIATATGPTSFAPGRPDIKRFSAPQTYPIRGIDLSVHNGRIDWPLFLNAEKPDFVYVRAHSWAKDDTAYHSSITQLHKAKVDHGAEVVFSYCNSHNQFTALTRIVPNDPNALPVAITLVSPVNERWEVSAGNEEQANCYPKTDEEAKLAILAFAEKIHAHYGKIPILHGNTYNLNRLTDKRFDKYMIWVDAYGKATTPSIKEPARYDTPANSSVLQLKGRNPWTLWQYTAARPVAGIGESSAEVFFGTASDYAAFKNGKGNAALTAALASAAVP